VKKTAELVHRSTLSIVLEMAKKANLLLKACAKAISSSLAYVYVIDP
jgi:hypothetical protein